MHGLGLPDMPLVALPCQPGSGVHTHLRKEATVALLPRQRLYIAQIFSCASDSKEPAPSAPFDAVRRGYQLMTCAHCQIRAVLLLL